MKEVDRILASIARQPGVEIRPGRKHRKVYKDSRYIISVSYSPAYQDRRAIRRLQSILRRGGIDV